LSNIDENGEIICPYCEKSYKLLASHLTKTHNIDKEKFKKEYPDYSLLSDNTRSKMRGPKSEEAKKNMSKAKKGKKLNHPKGCACFICKDQSGEKHPWYGKTRSEKTKRKIAETKKGVSHSNDCKCPFCASSFGEDNPMYGITGEDHPMYGTKRTEETKKKMSEKIKEIFNTEEMRSKMSKIRSKYLSNRSRDDYTSIELKTADYLDKLNIKYDPQHYIESSWGGYSLDFYLPNYKLVIECDGCYWHNCYECGFSDENERNRIDKSRNTYLINKNYNLLRIWEHDFKNGRYKKLIDCSLNKIKVLGESVFLN